MIHSLLVIYLVLKRKSQKQNYDKWKRINNKKNEVKQKKQDVLLGDSTGEQKSNPKFVKRNEARNETSEKRNDTNDRKRKSETKNQTQVHNKKAKTLEAEKNASYEKAKGMTQNSQTRDVRTPDRARYPV